MTHKFFLMGYNCCVIFVFVYMTVFFLLNATVHMYVIIDIYVHDNNSIFISSTHMCTYV